MAPGAPTELLIWSLYQGPTLVSSMEPFIGSDSVGTSTRTQWFTDLSAEIIARALDY
jgi:hypothetical protein